MPAFVGYTLAVDDLARTGRHLASAGVPHTRPHPERLVVPAGAALGAAITLRPAAA